MQQYAKQITFDQLPSFILELSNEVKELRKQISNIPAPKEPEEAPIHIDEAAKLTGMVPGTIYNLIHKKKFPYHKTGGRVHFFRSEIIAFIKNGKLEQVA